MRSPARRGAVVAVLLLASIVIVAVAGASTPARAARAVTITIRGFAFHPPTLHVRRGTLLTVTNHDSTAHTLTAKGHFNTGTVLQGHSVRIRLRHRGTYRYICTFHPFMTGAIVVR